ncbi:lytic transglycosylase domain-containing protein [Gordonia humi]|uniref:Membrane-bound lytic murein transglycosylase B n=1 Tax=Gordonia humi TaxID=686429 RepID=A0A840EPW5_9ACTN|nr:lytic murein transglycosylase [Gordonia humi]MBB4133732.1 membrane-bound lytic murein transglycosylase B [Gordonia humi]
MSPKRKQTLTAAFIAAGLVPLAGSLIGASGTTDTTTAAPAPVNVADVSTVAAPAAPETAPAHTAAPSTTTAAKTRTELTKPAPKLPKSVTSGDVPRINFAAYRDAEKTMAHTDRRCHIDWRLIAGIGRVESHHADLGATDRHGTLRTPIYGPTLDGSLDGNRVVADTDGGKLDGDSTYDRAVGPMQFLPATWKQYAADGNGDGEADPQNVFDAALTTARYLCDEGLDLRKAADRVTAVLRYNNSMDYVSDVLGFARSY